jgi:hypothetical protein
MAHLKMCSIEVKAETNSLAHTLIISIVKATNNPNYEAYRKGQKIRPVVQNLPETTGNDLDKGAGIPVL